MQEAVSRGQRQAGRVYYVWGPSSAAKSQSRSACAAISAAAVAHTSSCSALSTTTLPFMAAQAVNSSRVLVIPDNIRGSALLRCGQARLSKLAQRQRLSALTD